MQTPTVARVAKLFQNCWSCLEVVLFPACYGCQICFYVVLNSSVMQGNIEKLSDQYKIYLKQQALFSSTGPTSPYVHFFYRWTIGNRPAWTIGNRALRSWAAVSTPACSAVSGSSSGKDALERRNGGPVGADILRNRLNCPVQQACTPPSQASLES